LDLESRQKQALQEPQSLIITVILSLRVWFGVRTSTKRKKQSSKMSWVNIPVTTDRVQPGGRLEIFARRMVIDDLQERQISPWKPSRKNLQGLYSGLCTDRR